jgi:hypothetical protein
VPNPAIVSRFYVWSIGMAWLISKRVFGTVVRFVSALRAAGSIMPHLPSTSIVHPTCGSVLLAAAMLGAMRRNVSAPNLRMVAAPMILGRDAEGYG